MTDPQPILIERASPALFDDLTDIWLRSVRATHHFLSEEDIQTFLPIVREQALPGVDLWVAFDADRRPLGFLGIAESKIEMLFIDPNFTGRGIGRRFLDHAARLHPKLLVDVNEANADALGFYEHWGFRQTGRSELDDWGKPFPLLHLAYGD